MVIIYLVGKNYEYLVLNRKSQFFAVFILGFMLGTIVCTLRIGNNIDRLNQLNNELKLELDNTLTELSELKAKRLNPRI